jgi:hypothetical protein
MVGSGGGNVMLVVVVVVVVVVVAAAAINTEPWQRKGSEGKPCSFIKF